MAENLDILNVAVSLVIKAAIMAGRFSGRARKRSLKRLAAMDADTKNKEILFLKDKVYLSSGHRTALLRLNLASKPLPKMAPMGPG